MAQQQKVGRPNDQRPDEWQQDLNPDPTAGQNHGIQGSSSEKGYPTADQIKELHGYLNEYTRDELKQIVVVPVGNRLEQGAKYVDLKDPDRQEFTAMGHMEAGPDSYYVPKGEIDYQLWNRLTDVQNPEQTGEANED
jgi:hypothetical protein